MQGHWLTVSVIAMALAACGQAEPPPPEPTAQTEVVIPRPAPAPGEEDDAVPCMAYLALQSAAIAEGHAEGDAAALANAAVAFRAKAEETFGATELAQYYASTVAVLDDTPPGELQAEAAACVARVPAQ